MNHAGLAQPTRTVPNAEAISNHFFFIGAGGLNRSFSGLLDHLNEFGQSSEIGCAPDLVGVVVVGAGNGVEEFGWLGRLEDLAAEFERNNLVLIAMDNQFR